MNFLVTAGPTREPIDPVRFISNRSSGKMGYAIAQAALDAGHDVVLVSGPVCLAPPARAELVRITTSDEMFDAVQQRITRRDVDVLVMCAAIADFKPAEYHAHKIKKSAGLAHVALIPTRDVLRSLAWPQKKIVVVGFAAETQSLAENAKKKLREKNCDVIAANDVSRMDTGFESDENELTLFFHSGEARTLTRANKVLLAKKLVDVCEALAKEKR
jgi:phosphopantothenoylcysteine decarboxylase / phosphopantothenate---cysteine ligase